MFLAGTGALRLASQFVKKFASVDGASPTVYLPAPTWGNHIPIFKHAGLKTSGYR
jgi:aspartate aminotransferase